jgi:hypothetical protein
MMSGRVDIGENASLLRSCPNGPPSSCGSSKAPVQIGTIANGDSRASINNARVEQIVAVVRHGCHSGSWYVVAARAGAWALIRGGN